MIGRYSNRRYTGNHTNSKPTVQKTKQQGKQGYSKHEQQYTHDGNVPCPQDLHCNSRQMHVNKRRHDCEHNHLNTGANVLYTTRRRVDRRGPAAPVAMAAACRPTAMVPLNHAHRARDHRPRRAIWEHNATAAIGTAAATVASTTMGSAQSTKKNGLSSNTGKQKRR